MKHSVNIASFIAFAFSCLVTFAHGQQQSQALEEVLVTARKRAENQQTVPLAVTAVSASDMAANNIRNIAGLAAIAPGLDQREGRKQGGFAIRGVGQVRLNELGADPGVGVYLDGIFLARNDSQLVDALTIQSVQILRGPQGTLFGKNSVGGAILVTTKDPFETFTLTAGSTVDSLGQRNAQIALDMPLLEDRLFSKLTLASVRSDGYGEDLSSGTHYGDDDRLILAFQTLWHINESSQLKTLLYLNNQDEKIPPYNCQFVTDTAALSYMRAPGRAENYKDRCQQVEPLIDEEKIEVEDFGLTFVSRDLVFGATYDHELPFGDLKSITSITRKGDSRADFDIDATDLIIVRNTTYIKQLLEQQGLYDKDGSRYSYGQELQLSGSLLSEKLRYTVGVFGAWESIDNHVAGQMLTEEGWVGFEQLPGLPRPNDVCVFSGIIGEDCLYVRGVPGGDISSLDNTSYALFSQVLYDLTPSLQLTGGLRYSYEERKIKIEYLQGSTTPPATGVSVIPNDPTTGLPITVMTETQFNMLDGQQLPLSRGIPVSGSATFERLSPMASLSWIASDQFEFDSINNLMLYLTVSEGFKSGGFNAVGSDLSTFDPEFVISTELGLKMDALNRSLRFNAALYHSNYEDIQLVVSKLSSLGAPIVSTNNAGLATMQGFEFETTWQPSASLLIRATGNYIDAQFQEYDDEVLDPVTATPIQVDRSDEPFPYIPEYVYSFSVRYSWDTAIGRWAATVSRNTRGSVSWQRRRCRLGYVSRLCHDRQLYHLYRPPDVESF